jgi:glycosyl transferase family 25
MGYRLYVINLERSEDRLAQFQAQAGALGLPFTKVPAVDGGHPDFSYQPAKAREGLEPGYKYYRPLVAEEVGCHLSHIKALETFLADGVDYAVVLEDDAVLAEGFAGKLDAILARHRQNPAWDVLKLHGAKKGWALIEQVADGLALVEHCSIPGGSFGAVWTRAGASRFLDAHHGHPVGRPLDVDLRYPWEFGAVVLTVKPPLVCHEDCSGGATTTICDRRAAFKADDRWLQNLLRKWSFQAHFLVKRLAYNIRRHGAANALLLECGRGIESPAADTRETELSL